MCRMSTRRCRPRFDEVDVKDGMNLHGRGKFEANGDGVDDFEDSKGTNESIVELVGWSIRREIATRELDKLTDLIIGFRSASIVCRIGVGLLGVNEISASVVVSGLDSFGEIDGCWDIRIGDSDLRLRMISEACEERGLLGRGISGVVVSEFGERQERSPVVLKMTGVLAKVLLENLIGSFGLAIRLRMKGCREHRFDLSKAKDFFPELRGECRSSVGDDIVREAMEADNLTDELTGKIDGSVGCLGRNEMSHFRKSVDDHQDGVVTLGVGELRDMIHRQG